MNRRNSRGGEEGARGGLNHRRRWWQTTQRGRLHWMGRRIGKGWGKRFSRDAIYAQTVANNTSRLIRNVCQMKAQQRSRERRNRGEDPKYLSLITGWYVSVFLLGSRNLSRRLGSRSFVFELCTIGTMGYRVSRHRTRNDPFLPSSPTSCSLSITNRWRRNDFSFLLSFVTLS